MLSTIFYFGIIIPPQNSCYQMFDGLQMPTRLPRAFDLQNDWKLAGSSVRVCVCVWVNENCILNENGKNVGQHFNLQYCRGTHADLNQIFINIKELYSCVCKCHFYECAQLICTSFMAAFKNASRANHHHHHHQRRSQQQHEKRPCWKVSSVEIVARVGNIIIFCSRRECKFASFFRIGVASWKFLERLCMFLYRSMSLAY